MNTKLQSIFVDNAYAKCNLESSNNVWLIISNSMLMYNPIAIRDYLL